MKTTKPTTRVFLSIGSNLGDRQTTIQHAINLINRVAGRVTQSSSRYETSPWAMEDDAPPFLNQVIEIQTTLLPLSLLYTLQQIESYLGRARHPETLPKNPPMFFSRPIDIDILYYGNLIIATHDLHIPHPLIPFRKFVLVPLDEIAGDNTDPVSGHTIRELLDRCLDNGTVKRDTGTR